MVGTTPRRSALTILGATFAALTVFAGTAAPARAHRGSAPQRMPRAPVATKAHSCPTGDAPLPDRASTSPASAAGLVARGWEAWSGGLPRGC
jgi:hypothetical protein